jgi:hypothetical protein
MGDPRVEIDNKVMAYAQKKFSRMVFGFWIGVSHNWLTHSSALSSFHFPSFSQICARNMKAEISVGQQRPAPFMKLKSKSTDVLETANYNHIYTFYKYYIPHL